MTLRVLNVVLLGTMLLLFGCKKDQEPEPPMVTLEVLSGAPGKIISITHEEDISSGNYSGTMDGNGLLMNNLGSSLCFMVPSLSQGDYPLSIMINGKSHDFTFSVLDQIEVQNPEQYLADFSAAVEADVLTNREFKDSLIANGYMDAAVVAADKQVLADLKQQADAEYASLSIDQKQSIANLIEANKELFERIDLNAPNLYGFGKTEALACDSLRQKGLASTNLWEKSLIAIRFMWCEAIESVSQGWQDALTQLNLLLESDFDGRTWLLNNVFRKADKAACEDFENCNKEFVAEDIEDVEERKTTLTWENGEIKPIFVRLKFRTPLRSDIGTASPLGEIAESFDSFIKAYEEFITNTNLPLVWRPEFLGRSRTIDFNRELSIPKESIDNPKVILVNTQVNNNDEWEVIFATDDTTSSTQDFSYDIVYDDGYVQIQERFDGRIKIDTGGCDPISYSTITDPRDGQVYDVVQIGCQVWFAENLRYSGSIFRAIGWSDWVNSSNLRRPAWCYYDNDPAYDAQYGKLYNWYAVYSDNICPQGWHIPTSSDFNTLIAYLGGEPGTKMKNTTGWPPSDKATNESGFSALPFGLRSGVNGYFGTYDQAYYWTTTSASKDQAYRTTLSAGYDGAYQIAREKGWGFSCRCIKD